MKKIAYIRVSMPEQRHDRQVAGLTDLCDELHVETLSACNAKRPVYELVLERLMPGDMLVVWDLDRAFRSVVDALTEAEKLRARGVHFQIANLHIDTTTPAGIFVYTMLSALAEFERRTLSQRTKEDLGAPWPKTVNDATRGTALHLALRTCLTRPELIPALAAATGLEEITIMLVSERAETLKNWLAAEGYTDLRAEIPVLGFSPEGAEIPGSLDLLAVGSGGCILIDHKSGGGGEGFGSYWPQLSSYVALVAKLFPHYPLKGVAVFWLDHGWLELAGPQSASGSPDATEPLSPNE